MSGEFMLADALKGQQWERAKGELRAAVFIQGCCGETKRWEKLNDTVESFIKDVEGDGLQE